MHLLLTNLFPHNTRETDKAQTMSPPDGSCLLLHTPLAESIFFQSSNTSVIATAPLLMLKDNTKSHNTTIVLLHNPYPELFHPVAMCHSVWVKIACYDYVLLLPVQLAHLPSCCSRSVSGVRRRLLALYKIGWLHLNPVAQKIHLTCSCRSGTLEWLGARLLLHAGMPTHSYSFSMTFKQGESVFINLFSNTLFTVNTNLTAL